MTSTPPAAVTVVAQHTLQCLHAESHATLPVPLRLGPLDATVTPFIPVAVAFVYRRPEGTGAHPELIPIDRLKRAIARLLDFYPHLTGRLRVSADDGARTIDRLESGVALLQATCGAPLQSFAVPDGRLVVTDLPGGGNDLLAPFDPSLDAVCRGPLFSVQQTRFACGGVALGVRVLHTICDADGFFQLMHDLAELYRGSQGSEFEIPTLQQPPCIRPYLADFAEAATPQEVQAALAFKPAYFHLEPEPEPSGDTSIEPPPPPLTALIQPPVTGRVLRFSADEVRAIKARATDVAGSGWVSTFEALAAHVFQCAHRARLQYQQSTGDKTQISTCFLTPLNWRSASRLGLPPRYFHNAVVTLHMTLPPSLLAEGSLVQVAGALHALLQTASREDTEGTLRWIAAQPDKRRIRHGFQYGSGSFMVSQWCKMGIYAGLDFDVDSRGEPVAPALVSTPFTPISLIDGLTYFLDTEEQAPSIDVSLALINPLWAILDGGKGFHIE